MKLSPNTLSIIKSFSQLNPSMIFPEGNVLKTLSTSRSVYAKAVLDQSFTTRFAIADVTRFLGALSLFENPELVFEKKQVKIFSGNQKIRYTYADEEAIVKAPETITLPSSDITVTLSEDALKATLKAASALGVPDVAIVGEDEKIFLQALDASQRKNDMCRDLYSLEIGETKKSFIAVFKSEYFHKLIMQGYNVAISTKGISHFKAVAMDLEYYIALESKLSQF